MKKFACVLLAATILTSVLVGCANTGSTSGQSTTGNAGSGNGSNVIVYTQKTMDQFFHVALEEGVKKSVESNGYVFESANSNNDSTLQNNQMQNFIAKKPAGIIANAVDSDALNDAATAAVESGIPVVMVDNPASTAVVDAIVAYDNYGNGKMAAELIVEKLTEKYGSPQGRVVNVYGAMSSESWRLRKEGFDDVMAQYPDIEYIEVPGDGEQTKSQEALTNVIAQYNKEIDAVTCPSDAPGLGCAEALKIADMWKKVGEDGHVIFVTGDGEPDAVVGLIDGYYDGIVVEDAYAYGPMAVDLLVNYIFKGEEVPTSGTYTNEDFYWKTAEFSDSDRGPVLMVPPYVMDASNATEEAHWGVQALMAEGRL
ncbi:MAG: sugar ABC transporter substrate-binding protein [Oscillospiraceae bacterium]